MGTWGARWLEVEPQHVSPEYVLWATCKLVDIDLVPASGLVARVELTDDPRQLWMLLRHPYAEMCTTYLGWPEDLVVRTDCETLAHWHLRHLTYKDAARLGRLDIEGKRTEVQAFLRCIRPSPFAGTQPASATNRTSHPPATPIQSSYVDRPRPHLLSSTKSQQDPPPMSNRSPHRRVHFHEHDSKEIMARLGHASPQAAMVYQHTSH